MLHPHGARRLVVGLVVAVLAGAGGAVLTPVPGEAAALSWVAELRSPTLTIGMHLVTVLGDLWFVVLAALVIGMAVRTAPGARRVWLLLAVTIVGSSVIVTTLKLIVARPRPAEAIVSTFTSAYPSGHAVRAFAVYGLVVWACHRSVRHRLLRAAGIVLGVLLVAVITLSRLYLGVHLPSDLVAGALLGGFWLAVALRSVRLPPAARTTAGGAAGPEGT